MTNQEDFSKITPSPNYSAQIKQFEDRLLNFINQYGLPVDSVLVTDRHLLKTYLQLIEEQITSKMNLHLLDNSKDLLAIWVRFRLK